MKTEQENRYLISETAKLVGVESHVLRYWEDELKLPIRRNELGHRYYTKEDVEQFIEIKKLKEQGLQLKAIRTVLTDSRMQFVVPLQEYGEEAAEAQNTAGGSVSADSKAARLQFLLHNLVSQAVRENNEELVQQIRESVIKELDYQFRVQEEEDDRREREQITREEEHYRRLDERLREVSEKGRGSERTLRREQKEQHREQKRNEKLQRREQRKNKLRARVWGTKTEHKKEAPDME